MFTIVLIAVTKFKRKATEGRVYWLHFKTICSLVYGKDGSRYVRQLACTCQETERDEC